MNQLGRESTTQGAGHLEEKIGRAKHDLRAPLVNIQGFSSELKEALDCFAALMSQHRESLPSNFYDRVEKMLKEDVNPCLGYLESAVAQLDQRLDTLADRFNTDLGDQQQGGY